MWVINSSLFCFDIGSEDYSVTQKTLIFVAGSVPPAAQDFLIPIIDDRQEESAETINVNASTSHPRAQFNGGEVLTTVKIIDDDGKFLKLWIMACVCCMSQC